MSANWLTTLDNRSPLGLVFLRNDGKILNLSAASQGNWDAVPTGGVISKDYVLPLAKPVAAGPLANNGFALPPEMSLPTNAQGVATCICTLGTDGGVAEQIDQIPLPYLDYRRGIVGGFTAR